MLNWIKAFGKALIFVTLLAGSVALLVAIAVYYSPYVLGGLIAVMLLGVITWAFHTALY